MWTGWDRSARAVEACAFMVENLACEFRAFHYVRGNRIGEPAGSSSPSQEMTHADAFPCSNPAQSGGLGAGTHPQHTRAIGARDRRFRVRSGAELREPGRQGAMP